jgi:glycosyltransferase involved in cell wall biosynthesis
MRITALVRPGSVNANYRAHIPFVALSRRGHDVRIESGYSIGQAARYFDHDAVYFCRLWEEPFQRLAQELRAAGVAVVWDSDDDLTAIPKGSPGYLRSGGFKGQRILADMRSMMRLANLLTTPTEVLADRFRGIAGTEVRVIENYLAPPFIAPPKPKRNQTVVVVGWVAGNEHQVDVERLGLRAVIGALLDRHQQIRFMTIGLGLGLSSDRYSRVQGVHLSELTRHIAHFDIGIAPIADIPFNRARSNIKVKEYAAAGVPWLASAVGPYLGLGENEGGRLVDNDRWSEEFDRLIGDPDARALLSRRSLEWARRHSVMAHAHRWEGAFADAVERAR